MKKSQWYALWAMLVFLQSNDAAILHRPNLDAFLTVVSAVYALLAILWMVKEE